jgi:PAS domain S-box-containing protein
MLLLTGLAVLPIGVLNLQSGARSFALVLFGTAAFCALGVYLNRKGYYVLAASLLLLLVYIAVVFTIIDGAGFSDPGVVALPILIVLASLLFDQRAIFAATLASILTLVLLYVLHGSGLLTLAQAPGTARLATLGILMAVAGIIAWTAADLREKNLADIRSREARFRTLFEQSTDAILILEGDTYVEANAGALRMFRATLDQIIGRTPHDLSPEIQPGGQASRRQALDRIRRAREQGPQRFEWQHRRPDGSILDVEVSLNRADLGGRPVLLSILRDLSERKLAELAAEEERQRLARELHDAVSQTLWSASLIADVLPELWDQDQEKGRERLRRLRQLTHAALAEMRALLLELRPAALVERPLPELLQRLCEAASGRTGWKVNLRSSGDCSINPDVHLGFYRIAQEALNNAARHAAASQVVVELQCGPDHARLAVHDDGRGFDPSSPHTGQHLGIAIMRERAASIGGRLLIESRPESGTRVEVIWPDQVGSSHE